MKSDGHLLMDRSFALCPEQRRDKLACTPTYWSFFLYIKKTQIEWSTFGRTKLKIRLIELSSSSDGNMFKLQATVITLQLHHLTDLATHFVIAFPQISLLHLVSRWKIEMPSIFLFQFRMCCKKLWQLSCWHFMIYKMCPRNQWWVIVGWIFIS